MLYKKLSGFPYYLTLLFTLVFHHSVFSEISLTSASMESSGADIHGVCFPTFEIPANVCEDVITAANIPVPDADNINAISDGHAANTVWPAAIGTTVGIRYSFQDGATGVNADIQAEIAADGGEEDIWTISSTDGVINAPVLMIQGSPPPDGVAATNGGNLGLMNAGSDVDGYAFDGMADGRFYYTLDATATNDPAAIFTKLSPVDPQTVFATAAQLGLVAGDVLDAISVGNNAGATFDGGDFVYFSLEPGSTSLMAGGQFAGQSAADIFRVNAAGGAPFLWAQGTDLGLAAGDNLDALEIGDPGEIEINITIDVTSSEGNFTGSGIATLNPLDGSHSVSLSVSTLSSQAKGMVLVDLIIARDMFLMAAPLSDPFEYTGASQINGSVTVDAGLEGDASASFSYANNLLDIDITLSNLGTATIPPSSYVLDSEQYIFSGGQGIISSSGTFYTDAGVSGSYQSDYTVSSMPTLVISQGIVSGVTNINLVSNTMTASGSSSWIEATNFITVPVASPIFLVLLSILLGVIWRKVRILS